MSTDYRARAEYHRRRALRYARMAVAAPICGLVAQVVLAVIWFALDAPEGGWFAVALAIGFAAWTPFKVRWYRRMRDELTS